MKRFNINLMEIPKETCRDSEGKTLFKEVMAQKCP